MNAPPWFVYNSVIANGINWACVSPSGQLHPELKTVSTKAAVALWSIHDDTYSRRLLQFVKDLSNPRYGYYAGRFESGAVNTSLNLNTNAVILEAILYVRLNRRSFLDIDASGSEIARLQH